MAVCQGNNSEIQFEEFMKAYDTISHRREQLINTVENTKIHIEDNFNDILQALQCRKTQLLRQIDVFTTQQMCAYKSRLAELVLMLVGLKMDSTDSCHSLKDILKEEISNILGQSQSNQLQVKINNSAVKLAVSKWGEINTNKIWMKSQGSTASCLPENIEEYDDGENHLFYKSISNEAYVTINIPRLWDQGADYWLHRKNKYNPNNLKSSCDVKNWLSLMESEHEPEIMCGLEFPSLFSSGEGSSSSIEVLQWDDELVDESVKLPRIKSIRKEPGVMEQSMDANIWLARPHSSVHEHLKKLPESTAGSARPDQCNKSSIIPSHPAVWIKDYTTKPQIFQDPIAGKDICHDQGSHWLHNPQSCNQEAENSLDEKVKQSFSHYFTQGLNDWKIKIEEPSM